MERIYLEEFLKINFLEGSLVEYEDGYKFSHEYSRGKITKFDITDRILNIITDNEKAFLRLNLKLIDTNKDIKIIREEEIYFLNIPILYCYALSQKVITIPKKINYEEFINFRFN